MNILITAGPTREYFDSVRFLSNGASGRLGFALAAHAAEAGHTVHLVTGPVSLSVPDGVSAIEVVSAQEMFDACVGVFEDCDVAVMTAAVCDYRPAVRHSKKLKKSEATRVVELEATPDICAHLGRHKGSRLVIGFAMEDHDHREHAMGKLRRKCCDAVVLNGVSNLASEEGELEILFSDGSGSGLIRGKKSYLASEIFAVMLSLAGG